MAEEIRTQKAAGRGERLDPPRTSRLYWHLTQLRIAYEDAVKTHVVDGITDGDHRPRLLDYGCGNMPYRPVFEPVVSEYVGADLAGNEMADVLISETGHIQCDEGSFDIVLSSQVLEHVLDPAAYLTEAARVLRPGGVLLLSTHGVWQYHPDPRDLWRWTCDGLRLQIESAGFEIAEFRGVMGPEATAIQIWQDARQKRVPKRLRPKFFRFCQWQMERADAHCPDEQRDRDACVYVVTARKPPTKGENG